MINFLKPTKQKIIGTIIVLITLLIGSFINEAITNQFLPEELLTTELEGAITDIVESDMEGFVALGLKILAVNIVVNILLVYLSMCLIFKEKKAQKFY